MIVTVYALWVCPLPAGEPAPPHRLATDHLQSTTLNSKNATSINLKPKAFGSSITIGTNCKLQTYENITTNTCCHIKIEPQHILISTYLYHAQCIQVWTDHKSQKSLLLSLTLLPVILFHYTLHVILQSNYPIHPLFLFFFGCQSLIILWHTNGR